LEIDMSLTPEPFFRGENVCSCCDKPMYINDQGIIFHKHKGGQAYFMFCMDCAVSMTMSIAQDIFKVATGNADTALSYYYKFKNPGATEANLYRHADALQGLANKMKLHAEALEITRGTKDHAIRK